MHPSEDAYINRHVGTVNQATSTYTQNCIKTGVTGFTPAMLRHSMTTAISVDEINKPTSQISWHIQMRVQSHDQKCKYTQQQKDKISNMYVSVSEL